MDIRYYLVKNGTDTAAKAPYTIRVVPNGVANLNDLVSEILTRISSSEQRVRMVVTEATKVMLKHVLAGETVDFGGIRFKAQIPGSMDYEDSPFTPGVDEVVVCAYVDDELRDTFDGIVPVKLSAEEVAASIRVSNVMDIATENFGEIHGTAPFKVLGNGITLDGEGESAKLLDRKTGEVLATAEVTTVSKGQRATCAFAAVPGGIAKSAYVLEVTTFGLVGETTPRVFRKPVTLVEPIPEPGPKATATLHQTASAAIAGNDPFTEINRGISGLYLHSDGHTFAEGEKLTFKLVSEDLDEPDIRERTIAFVDNAPRVDNPFGDPIHTSLTGTVTFGNDSVEGEVAFVPEE